MRFPVKFMPIEQELLPAAPFLNGNVLNAGCGERDVTVELKAWHATHVDNCDIQTSIPGAFLCDLTKVPQPDSSYDSILCNAVLEHVPDPEAVMVEFHRLLVPGGHLVVSVPFLQPFHPTPYDFRRYTISGLEQLGEHTGFHLLHVRPIHSPAQTLGWLIWAYLEESGSKLGRLVCWLPIYLASRLFQRAPEGKFHAANAFQAVMVKE